MALIISDELLKNANVSESEIRLDLAVLLYSKGVFSLGKASELAGIHKIQMQRELATIK